MNQDINTLARTDRINLAALGSSAEELVEQLRSLPRPVQLSRLLVILSAADEGAEQLEQLTSRARE